MSINYGPGDEPAVAELAHLVEQGLGGPLDAALFGELFRIQAGLRTRQQELAVMFERQDLPPDAYLGRLNDALRASMAHSRALLGDERFLAIFGEAGLEPEGLVDRERFHQEAAGMRAARG